jgi:MFS family permease
MRLPAQPGTTWAIPSLVIARIVYAINWMNIGALFYLMSADLGGGVTGLGTLASSFYLGVGTMQIPGGILAAKQGPKKTVTMGIFISSLAVLGTSQSTALAQVAVLRFIVGAGMALVFSPSVVLATRFLRGRSGTGAGVINSAFDVGGLLGLFGWVLIAEATGWRPSLILSGSLGLATGLLVLTLVPKDHENNLFRVTSDKLTHILKNRNLILLGLGALGSNLGSVLISSFMIFYLHSELGQPPVLAGLAASMIVALPILTSLWGGQIYDRLKRPRRLLVISGLGVVGALLICSIPNTLVASIGAALAGIAVGPASTIAFAAARDLSGVEREYESLTIGWVNCISLTGSVWPPLVFSLLAGSLGYYAAWLGGAAMSLLCLTPMLVFALSERDPAS